MRTSQASADMAKALRVRGAAADDIFQGFDHMSSLPHTLRNDSLEGFLKTWTFRDSRPSAVIKRCVEMERDHAWYQSYVRIRRMLFHARMHTPGSDWVQEAFTKFQFDFSGLVGDVWTQWLTSQNVVLFWRDPEDPTKLPSVSLLDVNRCEYSNEFGVERLKYLPRRQKLSEDARERLGERYAKAMESGVAIELSEEYGEHFLVLTNGAMGRGFGMPDAKAVMLDLATWELFRTGDYNGAFARKNILRLSRRGHEIKQGNLAGQPIHFFKKGFGNALLKHLASVSGYSELAGNFDLAMEYIYLKPEFFSKEVVAATEARLRQWGGACVALMDGSSAAKTAELTMALRAEAMSERDTVRRFLFKLLNHKSFQAHPAQGLRIQWDESVLMNIERATAWVSAGTSAGLMSPQTGREFMGLDDAFESQRMRDAGDRPEDFTPPFEAKQGLVSNPNGRPPAALET